MFLFVEFELQSFAWAMSEFSGVCKNPLESSVADSSEFMAYGLRLFYSCVKFSSDLKYGILTTFDSINCKLILVC